MGCRLADCAWRCMTWKRASTAWTEMDASGGPTIAATAIAVVVVVLVGCDVIFAAPCYALFVRFERKRGGRVLGASCVRARGHLSALEVAAQLEVDAPELSVL